MSRSFWQATVLLLLVSTPIGVFAEESKPFQLALWNPAQIVSEDTAIKGTSLNLLNGKNTNEFPESSPVGKYTIELKHVSDSE